MVLTGASPAAVIEVRDHVARLRAQHPGRQIVSFLGGVSEMGALGALNKKFHVEAPAPGGDAI